MINILQAGTDEAFFKIKLLWQAVVRQSAASVFGVCGGGRKMSIAIENAYSQQLKSFRIFKFFFKIKYTHNVSYTFGDFYFPILVDLF